MKRKIPKFRTDAEAEEFVAKADLTKYDLSGMVPMRFEFERKTERVNMRFPAPLLRVVKERARRRGIPYQRWIREVVEQALVDRK